MIWAYFPLMESLSVPLSTDIFRIEILIKFTVLKTTFCTFHYFFYLGWNINLTNLFVIKFNINFKIVLYFACISIRWRLWNILEKWWLLLFTLVLKNSFNEMILLLKSKNNFGYKMADEFNENFMICLYIMHPLTDFY